MRDCFCGRARSPLDSATGCCNHWDAERGHLVSGGGRNIGRRDGGAKSELGHPHPDRHLVGIQSANWMLFVYGCYLGALSASVWLTVLSITVITALAVTTAPVVAVTLPLHVTEIHYVAVSRD